jgi:O-acetyl-ADP-ribose deacetylase (regulator of RNase III)
MLAFSPFPFQHLIFRQTLIEESGQFTMEDWQAISGLNVSCGVNVGNPNSIAFTSPDVKSLLSVRNRRLVKIEDIEKLGYSTELDQDAHHEDSDDKDDDFHRDDILYSRMVNNTSIQIVKGDITLEKTDAIVNAANRGLQHAGGVALAISKAAGSELLKDCNAYLRKRGSLEVGECITTSAGNLHCKKVIHAVGPMYQDGKRGEAQDLKKTVQNVLKTAEAEGCTSISMPLISSGIFGYPTEECVSITLAVIFKFLNSRSKRNLKCIRIIDIALGDKLDQLCSQLEHDF